jgi:hypothetical protein
LIGWATAECGTIGGAFTPQPIDNTNTKKNKQSFCQQK